MLVLGCGDPGDKTAQATPDPVVDSPVVQTETIAPAQGFSWVVPGELAAMALPGRERPLEQDAAFLDHEGIHVLVSLTEIPPDSEILAAHGIEQQHIPVQDFTPPTLQQMADFVAVVEGSVKTGTPVGVHCTAGLGRSGTMAAAYLVAQGASANEAISTVRQLRPGSIETSAQEDAVRKFEGQIN